MRSAVIAFCVLCCSSNVPAQTGNPAPGPSALETVSSDLSTAARDALAIVTAPLHFTPKEWTAAAGVIGGTALLFTFDRTARAAAARSHSAAANAVFNVGKEYGREIYGLALAGGLYAGGLASAHDGVRTTGRMLGESVVIAGLINIALKSLIGRARPQREEGPFEFRGFQTPLEYTSLPSGHATVAFSVSSVLSSRLKNPYASAGLYTLAGVTALSRVYHDDHWFSDSFLGAALGTAVGLAVSSEGTETSSAAGLFLTPSLSGVRVEYDF